MHKQYNLTIKNLRRTKAKITLYESGKRAGSIGEISLERDESASYAHILIAGGCTPEAGVLFVFTIGLIATQP